MFHYMIAMGFTFIFYFAYPLFFVKAPNKHIAALANYYFSRGFFKLLRNKYFIACIYGISTWLIMNLVVVPISKIGFTPIKHISGVLIGVGILIICIGLPAAWVADRSRLKREI